MYYFEKIKSNTLYFSFFFFYFKRPCMVLMLMYGLEGGSHPIIAKSWCEIETTVQVIWFRHLISFLGVTPTSPNFLIDISYSSCCSPPQVIEQSLFLLPPQATLSNATPRASSLLRLSPFDPSSLNSVRKCAAAITARTEGLDLLVIATFCLKNKKLGYSH